MDDRHFLNWLEAPTGNIQSGHARYGSPDRGQPRKSQAITRRIVCPSQIDLDSKTPVQIVLWKNTHAVRMFSIKAVLAAMIEGLALKVIGLANI